MSNKKSKKPKKQRKRLYEASLHSKRKHIHAPLSKELKKTHKKRRVAVRSGDEVRIVRGRKRLKGTVELVHLKTAKIFIKGHTRKKNDGSEVMQPIDASNVVVTKLNTEDKRRFRDASEKE